MTAAASVGMSAAQAAGGGVAEVHTSTNPQTGEVTRWLTYNAAAGDANNIAITFSSGQYVIDDAVRIAPGTGCRYLSPNDDTIVGCADVNDIQIGQIIISAEDRADTVRNTTNRAYAWLFSGDGNDKIFGGPGDETLSAGRTGDDEVHGGGGNDSITAGTGTGRLFGDSGNDHLWGQTGNDVIRGGTGDDELHGSTGNDTLIGEEDDDKLFGDDGNDSLDGSSGTNRLDGGSQVAPGRDTCVNGPVIVNCNP
ncbi:MAG TPA: calcium-binding protein [Streptosporangiaceae bacterium]|jgi:Ca2+-binding RTX toxin-like protein